MTVLCLVGYSGVGKTTIAQALLNQFPHLFNKLVDVSDIVRQFSKSQTGVDVIGNKQISEELKKQVQDKTIVVGVRERYLIEELQNDFSIETVVLFAEESVRFNRLYFERKLTWQQIFKKDSEERLIGLPTLIYQKENTFVSTEQPINDCCSEIIIKTKVRS